MILFDTDTCIGILRGYDSVILRRKSISDVIAVSFMTVAELYYGAEKSSNPNRNYNIVEQFLLSVTIINSDIEILKKFCRLKASLETQGIPLADADLLIAATCLVKCSLLVTGNLKHYERIDGLVLDNWIR